MTSPIQLPNPSPPTNPLANPSPAAGRDGIITTAELRAAGVSQKTINTRCRPGGAWRRLFSNVILLADTVPTRRQLLRAAVAQLGPETIITGVDALNAHGVGLLPSPLIHLLTDRERRTPQPGMLVERTSSPPASVTRWGLRFAPPARAAMDAARREPDADHLRDLLALPIHHGLCSLEDLRTESYAGGQRGASAVRTTLALLARTSCTYGHGLAKNLLRYVPLPPPQWVVTVCDAKGRGITHVDAWWDEVALGWQFGFPAAEQGPHLGHLALTAAGVVLVRTPAEDLQDIQSVARELVCAFAAAAKRKRPRVRGVSSIKALAA